MNKTNDIARLIKYKNDLLKQLYKDSSVNSKKSLEIKCELDALLFKYYKSLRTQAQ